jgi:hypothetical protein
MFMGYPGVNRPLPSITIRPDEVMPSFEEMMPSFEGMMPSIGSMIPPMPEDMPVKDTTPQKADEEDEDTRKSKEERPRSGGNARASFNAWFPIVFGSPYSQERTRSNLEGGQAPVTAIANSVSHGARGSANSHAVAFAGIQPSQLRSQQPNLQRQRILQ